MANFREVNDDILKDWLLYREDELSSLACDEDRKHWVYFDEISKKILDSIPKQNRSFVQKQLNILDDNFLDYLGYWNEKYYRNGFVDGVQIVMGCFEEWLKKGNSFFYFLFNCLICENTELLESSFTNIIDVPFSSSDILQGQ